MIATILYILGWLIVGAIPNIIYRLAWHNYLNKSYPSLPPDKWEKTDTVFAIFGAILGPFSAIPTGPEVRAIRYWISTKQAKKT